MSNFDGKYVWDNQCFVVWEGSRYTLFGFIEALSCNGFSLNEIKTWLTDNQFRAESLEEYKAAENSVPFHN